MHLQDSIASDSAAPAADATPAKKNFFVRLLESMQQSRQMHADRIVRQHWHLVEEARAHERRRQQADAAASASPELAWDWIENRAFAGER